MAGSIKIFVHPKPYFEKRNINIQNLQKNRKNYRNFRSIAKLNCLTLIQIDGLGMKVKTYFRGITFVFKSICKLTQVLPIYPSCHAPFYYIKWIFTKNKIVFDILSFWFCDKRIIITSSYSSANGLEKIIKPTRMTEV